MTERVGAYGTTAKTVSTSCIGPAELIDSVGHVLPTELGHGGVHRQGAREGACIVLRERAHAMQDREQRERAEQAEEYARKGSSSPPSAGLTKLRETSSKGYQGRPAQTNRIDEGSRGSP